MDKCLFVILFSISSVLGDVYDVQRLRQTLFANYSREAIPFDSNNSVKLQLRPPTIIESYLQEEKESLTIQMYIGMNWPDVRLSWEPVEFGGLQNIRITAGDVWRPDLAIYSQNPIIVLADMFSPTQPIVYSNGNVLWVPPTTTSVPCVHDPSNWPFDTMLCNMTIGSWTFDATMLPITYLKDEETLEDYKPAGEWKITKFEGFLEDTIYPCCPEPYTSLRVGIYVSRDAPLKGIFILFTLALLVIKFVSIRFLVSKEKTSYFVSTTPEFLNTTFFILGSECVLLGVLYSIIPSGAALPHIVSFLVFMVCIELVTIIFLSVTHKASKM